MVKPDYPTRQTSTSSTNKKCLSVLIQQVVVLLISIQIKISKRCLFDIFILYSLLWVMFYLGVVTDQHTPLHTRTYHIYHSINNVGTIVLNIA